MHKVLKFYKIYPILTTVLSELSWSHALVICKSHDKIDVYYSAGKNRDDIFVAEYKTKLPTEDDISRKLEALKREIRDNHY